MLILIDCSASGSLSAKGLLERSFGRVSSPGAKRRCYGWKSLSEKLDGVLTGIGTGREKEV